MTHLTWKPGDSNENRKAVWDAHKEAGLDPALRQLAETFGRPEEIQISMKTTTTTTQEKTIV